MAALSGGARVARPVRVEVQGRVSAGFEPVRQAFADNFLLRNELGAACCVFHRGEKAVDLWGGVRNVATGAPWEEDTMVVVYSATKGLAAMTMALAHSRGWLDYDERVCAYWPEFAQQSKDGITVRQLLARNDWPRCWRGRGPPGRLASGRLITLSPSASTKARFCAASTRRIARSGNSFRKRSPRL